MPQVTAGQTASGIVQSLKTTPEAFLKANPTFAAQSGEKNSYLGLTGNIKVGQNYVIPGQEPAPVNSGGTPTPGSGTYPEDLTAQNQAKITANGTTAPPSAPVSTSDAARAALQAKEDSLVAPTPFSATDTLNKLRSSQGVANDETALATNQTEQAQIQNDLNQFKQTSGQGMTESGRLGAISEKEANANYRLNQLNIEQTAITGRIATKNAYIQQALQAGAQDYATAKATYDSAYQKASDAITSFNSNLETQKKDAMTGFTTLTNLIKDNNISVANLSPALKAQIDTLSIQAGIPAGTFEALATAHPDAKILAPMEVTHPDGSKSVYFFIQDPKTGQPTLIKTLGIGGGSGGTGGAAGGTYAPGTNPTVDSWVNNIRNGSAKLTDVPSALRSAVSLGMASVGGSSDQIKSIIDQAKSALTAIDPATAAGFKGAIGTNLAEDLTFGLVKRTTPGFQSSGYIDNLNRFKSILTLPNLNLLKGMGRVTQKEFDTLQGALTSLSTNMTEAQYKTEFTRISDVVSKMNINNLPAATSTPAGMTLMVGPDGKDYNVPNANVSAFITAGGKKK